MTEARPAKYGKLIVACGILGAAGCIAFVIFFKSGGPAQPQEKETPKTVEPPPKGKEEVRKDPPADPDEPLRLLVKVNQTESIEEKLDLCNRALALRPNLPDAYLQRANLHILRGDIPKAYDDLSSAIRLSPDMQGVYLMRADLAARAGKAREGVEDMTRVLAQQPGDPQLTMKRGVLWVNAGDCEAAIKDFNEAKSRGADPSTAEGLIALALAMGGKTDQALAEAERLIAQGPPDGAYAARAVVRAHAANDQVTQVETSQSPAKESVIGVARAMSQAYEDQVMIVDRELCQPAIAYLRAVRERMSKLDETRALHLMWELSTEVSDRASKRFAMGRMSAAC